MTEQPYVDPHHRLPDADWGQVRRAAAVNREAYLAEHGEPEPDPDLVALAAGDPDLSLFPDADGDGIPDGQDPTPNGGDS